MKSSQTSASFARTRARPLSGKLGMMAISAALVVAFGAWHSIPALAEGSTQVVPAFVQAPAAATTATASSETAVFAGGCFWGVQGVFQHVKGVTSAVSGYAGGDKASADYGTVSGGRTGHAESVQVRFDPRQVSYAQLLQIYFSVAHDPTQLNRQGPDSGTQYRSAVFPANEAQAAIAKAYIDQLNAAHAFKGPIATKIEPGKTFYAAEAYHQDYLTHNPNSLYIMINDLPKVADLKKLFPAQYRSDPVLVSKAS